MLQIFAICLVGAYAEDDGMFIGPLLFEVEQSKSEVCNTTLSTYQGMEAFIRDFCRYVSIFDITG